jgi:UDP-2,3-diacylglucosamine hydrolase
VAGASPGSGRQLLISDLHLHAGRPETTRLFHAFLRDVAPAANALHILGDLFEYWAGDDDLDEPFNREICAALRGLAQRGVHLTFLHGNRDFLIGAGFAAAAGATLVDEPVVLELGGHRTLLLHGDVLCTDDLAYQQFRAQVRNPQWQQQFLALPLAARKRKIEEVREFSEQQKQTKATEIMDVNDAAVHAAFRSHAVARMIHGHTHRPARHELVVDGRPCERWVLPDWYASGGYLACEADGWRAFALG